MALHVQSFTKGIDKDASVNKYPKDAAYHIENFRFITDEGLTTMSLENIKGTTFSFQLPNSYLIWGHTVLRNTLVILAINPNKVTNDGTDRIYVATINEDGTITGLTQKCQVELDFNLSNKITDIVGRYESAGIQKIYWCDSIHRVKFANIADPNIASKPANWYDTLPSVELTWIMQGTVSPNGTLKSGMVQYAYQQYNLHGAATNYSVPSALLGLSDATITGTDYLFTGSNIETSSGKAVLITLDLDTNLNRVRVVRILHTSLLNDPEINIIYDGEASSLLTILDTGGTSLGTLTINELTFSNYTTVPKNLETKNNILFPSNIKEEMWDVDYDARAYSYASSGLCHIYALNDPIPLSFSYSQLINNVITVPETFDCINSYNDISNVLYETRYLPDGFTFGGEGINVKYTFFTTYEVIDNSPSSPIVETSNSINCKPTDGSYKEFRLSFHRDEIYSLAVIFFNDKGQKSYPKWITDVRTPKTSTYPLTYDQGKFANILRISVELKNVPEGAVAYQILKCERTSEDRTILAQGLVGATREHFSYNCAYPTLTPIIEYFNPTFTNRRLIEFISPEICFNKNLKYTGGDYLDFAGVVTLHRKFVKIETDTAPFVNSTNFDYQTKVAFVINKLNETFHSYSVATTSVSDVQIATPVTNLPTTDDALPEAIVVGSYTYENYVRAYGAEELQGLHGTVAMIQISSDLNFNALPLLSRYFAIYNYKSPKYPYGGPSYSARQQRTYIACSELKPVSNLVSNVADVWGDTYISKFEYLRTSVAPTMNTETRQWFAEVFTFPVETSIDTRWRSGTTFTQEVTNSGGSMLNLNAVLKQEKAGVYSKDSGARTYTQKEDLYAYNSVYSKSNNTFKYIPKPTDLVEDPVYDARIIYSDRKFNNENVDSWTVYRALNFKDVDTNYGPINATINYNHDFIFFQDNGIGIASIEERELLQSTTGTTSIIGQGGILSRYDYIYTNGGCQDKDSIVMGRYRLYWYDRMNNSLFSFNRDEGINNISKLNGLHAFFNNIGVSNIINVISGVDPKYNDIYFTIKTTTGFYTLVYNEIGKLFTQFVTVDSDRYIEFENYLYSVKDDNQVYLHNVGNYGSFHGTIYPSKLTLVINPRQMLVNRFDILELLTRVTSGGTELHETFTTLRIRDSYQDTEVITLQDDVNIKERLRKWRFNSIWNTDTYNSRFKDSYVTIDLEFTNDGSKHIVLSDIIMLYQESFSK